MVAEVVCGHCCYVSFISLPTSNGRLFGIPDELAATLLAGIQTTAESGMSHAQMCASRARFWSLAYRLAVQPHGVVMKGVGDE